MALMFLIAINALVSALILQP